MSTENLCRPYGVPATLPGLDSNSLYCLTPNTIDSTAVTNMVQACCSSNPLQKMGGCDYCVIEQEPAYWFDNSATGGAADHSRQWASCLSRQSRTFNVSGGRASACNVPSAAAVTAGRPGWALWSVVALVGLGSISGALL